MAIDMPPAIPALDDLQCTQAVAENTYVFPSLKEIEEEIFTSEQAKTLASMQEQLDAMLNNKSAPNDQKLPSREELLQQAVKAASELVIGGASYQQRNLIENVVYKLSETAFDYASGQNKNFGGMGLETDFNITLLKNSCAKIMAGVALPKVNGVIGSKDHGATAALNFNVNIGSNSNCKSR